MDKKKILVVEDEKNISEVLAYNLKKAGYDADTAGDGETGLMKALQNDYDLILLDIMLPKMDGFEVCERVRIKSSVPIIFVTAREDEKDKIFGLETGGDDYVTKPFSVKELLSRINANIRRSKGEIIKGREEKPDIFKAGDLEIDSNSYTVRKKGVELELSKKDYDLLVYLAKNAGKAYSREDLLEAVWGYEGFYGDIRTVDVAISRLRSKIEDEGATKFKYILSKRNVGYYFCKM